jgi:hypothetical protein
MAKAIAPDVAARDAAKVAMKEINKNPDLLKVFNRIRGKYNEITASDVMGRYDIGKEVDRVVNDENKFGSSAVSKMAEALLLNDSDLYKWKDMATTWTAEEIKELATSKTATGNPLTVFHLTTLASLPDTKLRDKLLARCYKEGISARDLATIVTAKIGTRTNNPNGRKIVLRSPSAGTGQMLKLSEKWLNYSEAVDEMVFEPIDKKADEFATSDLAECLQKLLDASVEVRDAADANITKLESARQKVLSALEAQEREDEAKAAEKKAKAKMKGPKKLKLKKKLQLGKKKKLKLKLKPKKKLHLKSNGKAAIAKAKKKVAAGEPVSSE